MKRFVALGAFALLLGGCALPLPVQVASWAIDGISYMMTEKTVADHGISLVAQKDCAILRGVLNPGDFCRDLEAATAVAALDKDTRNEALKETEGASELLAELLEVENLADFDTAAGPADGIPEADVTFDYPLYTATETAAVPVALIYIPLVFEDGVAMEDPDAAAVETAALTPEPSVPPLVFEDGVPMDIDVPLATAEPALQPTQEAPEQALYLGNRGGEPEAGFYFVIGSFHQHLNARKLRNRYRALTPSVLAARIEKGTVYRVVVGPFDQHHAKDIHKRIYAAGISDSWAIRVKVGEWSMAMIDPPAEAPPMEVAEDTTGGWAATAIGYIQSLAQLIY